MEQPDFAKIATALVKAQKAFGPALKSSSNPHFRSKYADLSACVEAVIDALNDNGIVLTQQVHECDNGVIVETVFIHESGATMSCGRLHVPATKQDAQGYGSALTYARRYSLMAACGIAPEDDDGNAASRRPTQPAAPAVDITDHLAAIQASANSDELAQVYQDAIKACGQDQAAQAKVIAAKKARIERAKKEKGNGK
jgi:ERF superfamily